jgi:hypothetical protein
VLYLLVSSEIYADIIFGILASLCHLSLLIRYIDADFVFGTFCWLGGMLILYVKSHYFLELILPLAS